MAEFTTRDVTQIFYKDWGAGQPIVFSHGWPLSSDNWDAQMLFFLHHGYRVIAHDRRGHGRSAQPSEAHAAMILGRDWNGDAAEPAFSILWVMYDLWSIDTIQKKVGDHA